MAAVYAFVAAILLAAFAFGMPLTMVAGAVSHGLVYAFIRIIWTAPKMINAFISTQMLCTTVTMGPVVFFWMS